jgi:hypothetical protein
VTQCRGELGEEVAIRGHEDTAPGDAAVVEVGPVLQLPPGEVAGNGEPGDVGPARLSVVSLGEHVFGRDGELGDPCVPLGDDVAGLLSVGVQPGSAVALVGRGVGVAPRQHVVGDDDVAGVLATDAGRPGDDESSVPVSREADHELGVVVPAMGGVEGGGVREVAIELDPWHP